MNKEMYGQVLRFINESSFWEVFDKREIGTGTVRLIKLIF